MMQIPLCSSSVAHRILRAPGEAAKYVRTEFGDKNPAWLLVEISDRGDSRRGSDSKMTVIAQEALPELPGPALMGDGRGADH